MNGVECEWRYQTRPSSENIYYDYTEILEIKVEFKSFVELRGRYNRNRREQMFEKLLS